MQSERPPTVIDCRESSEVAVAAIAGTIHVPMGDTKSRLPELEEYADDLVVLACATELNIIVCVPDTPGGLEPKWAVSTYAPQST